MSRARTLITRYWGAIPVALAIALVALRACVTTAPLDQLAQVSADPRDPPGTVAREGSLLIARGGPVIIGFQSDQPGRLRVGETAVPRGDVGAPSAGTSVSSAGTSGSSVGMSGAPSAGSSGSPPAPATEMSGRGLVTRRIVLPAGPVAIHAALPAGARLMWSPVGRRGDPEYVPSSSLHPDPPERASFGTFAGAAPLDGLFAVALFALLVGSLVVLARRRLRAVSRELWIAMGVVFVLACVVRWLGLSSFGQTWDEDVNWAAGRNYVTNLLALDLSPGSWIWNFEHPPVMKYLVGIGAQFSDGFGPARAISATCIALGCALLVPIGARLYRLRVGVLAGLIAALLPPLIAHGQIVGHEAPTVLWWALGILLALGVHDDAPTQRQLILRLAAVGAVIGVAVASRFVNGLLGILCLAIVVEQAGAGRRLRAAALGALVMPAVALTTFYALWPRIWFDPINSLRASVDKLSKSHSIEPFLGEMTNQPGPHYFVTYLAATLPLGILIGVAMWAARSIRERERSVIIIGAWFVIPLAVMFSPVRQDGVRYVMPCVLALALIAAAGWDWVATRLERWRQFAFVALSSFLVSYLLVVVVRVHPYYLDYFGEHVGGAGNVARKGLFETAWWGEGVDRAVDYVNRHAAPGARVFRNCIEPYHLAWFRADLWTPMTNNPAEADWLVTYSPMSRPCALPKGARKVFSVDADGAVLAEVWQP